MIANATTAVYIDGGQLYLDNSQIMRSRTGIDVASVLQQPAVSGVSSRLSNNQIHIRTSSPLTVAGVALDESSLDAALAKLKGPVTIDWQSLSRADNLALAQLAQGWQDLVPLLQKQQWHKALEALRRMKQDDIGNDMMTVLQWMTGTERPRADGSLSNFLLPVVDEFLQGTPVTIWLQKMQIPSDNKLLNNDVVILRQAYNVFSGAYLSEHFRHKRRTGEFAGATRLPLHEAVISSQVGYRTKEGLMDTVWVSHLINQKLLDHQLTVAGLLERGKPDFILAVAIDGDDNQTLKSNLFRLFDQHNITFMDLSDLNSPQRIKAAKKQKADLLLSARMLSTEGTSSLSDSLKIVEVDIDIKLEDLEHGNIISNYHRATTTTAFKKRQGLQKAVAQSLQSIKGPLLADLFSHTL